MSNSSQFFRRLVFLAVTSGFTLITVSHAKAQLLPPDEPEGPDGGVWWNIEPDDPATPLPFEDPASWHVVTYDPPPTSGPQSGPPGDNSTWFMQGFDGIVLLTEPRDGIGGPKLGAGAIGGGDADQVQTLIISTDVVITGLERDDDGEVEVGSAREFRLGREDYTPDDDQFPWGVVKQTTGTVFGEYGVDRDGNDLGYGSDIGKSDLKLSADKDFSAGSIWEVGGDASLVFHTDLLIGDKAVQAPGAIFRVRGSNVGEVSLGDRINVNSRSALWDATLVNVNGSDFDQNNRGKAIVEFVLDEGGVTPIRTEDNLNIGAEEFSTETFFNVRLYGFMRVKLSEPTTAGSGEFGSEDDLVLFEADRITSGIVAEGSELQEGRFMDPDRQLVDGGGNLVFPHRPMLEGGTVISEYAGATYTWTINYFESTGGAQDLIVDEAVVLSNLVIDGTPGDYDGNGLDAGDLDAIFATIAGATELPLDTAQHEHDLNGDDVLSMEDAAQWIEHIGFAGTVFGDFDLDGVKDDSDRSTLLANLNSAGGWALGDYNGDAFVDQLDLDLFDGGSGGFLSDFNGDGVVNGADLTDAPEGWESRFGSDLEGADFLTWQREFGSASVSAAAQAVPEPTSIVLLGLALISAGAAAGRRRSG